MLPDRIQDAIGTAILPCFIYDAEAFTRRAKAAASLLDRCFFPVKTCPELPILAAAREAGCGLDLCSAGDLDLAIAVGFGGAHCSFTASCVDDPLLRMLAEADTVFDADSLEQGLSWVKAGGKVCGLRVAANDPRALYGAKFGLPPQGVRAAVDNLERAELRVAGLHLHDQHTNLSPAEFATRLLRTFRSVDAEVLGRCEYVNIGGGWPMRHGIPAGEPEIGATIEEIREGLADLGFNGAVWGEPGRWVAGPCGYWAAVVRAVKPHASGTGRRVVILDTSAPVPCRPSLAPFYLVRDHCVLHGGEGVLCDVFGSVNTALDIIGKEVRLSEPQVGDVLVATGQGAYTRALIPPFNERARPGAIVVPA